MPQAAVLNGNVAPSSSASSSSCSSVLFSFLSQDDLGTTLSIYTAILNRSVWFRQSSPSLMVTSNRLGFYITSPILRKPIETISVSLSPQNTSTSKESFLIWTRSFEGPGTGPSTFSPYFMITRKGSPWKTIKTKIELSGGLCTA
jgi:hypothetical protein